MGSSQHKRGRHPAPADDRRAVPTTSVPVQPRLTSLVRALVIVALGLATYWNSVANPFIIDDRVAIVENDALRDWADLPRVWASARESPVAGRPLVATSLAINYAFAGVSPGAYRLTNLAIHLACALLLLGVVRRTLTVATATTVDARTVGMAAWSVALVWTVHPLNSEVVNYVTQRTESLMALCLFAALYASARAHRSPAAWRWIALAVAACALGMASKETMVVAPLLVFVVDAWIVYPSVAAALRARASFYAALAATWGVLAALNWHGPRAISSGFSAPVGPWQYGLNQIPIVVDYLRLALWPRELVVLYGEPLALSPGDVVVEGLVVAALGIGTLVALMRRSWLGVAGAWFFIALSPASSIVPIATEVGAERRMYVPLVAIVCVVVWAAWRMLGRIGSRGLVAGSTLAVVIVALVAATIARNTEYASPQVLAQTVLDRRPSGYGRHMMAEALITDGRAAEAIPLLQQAIPGAPRAQFTLGVVYFNARQYRSAFAELEAFVRREPQLREVVTARLIMGRVLMAESRWAEAADQFREALRMQPAHGEAGLLVAQALLAADDYAGAVPAYTAYLERAPHDVEARANLGAALLAADRVDEAVAVLHRNLEIAPDHVASLAHLATAYFELRQPDRALLRAEHAATLQPNDPERHDFLGRVLAVMGRFDEARQAFRRAVELDPSHAPARDNLVKLDALIGSLGSRR